MDREVQGAAGRPRTLAVVGVSVNTSCGVRDHAQVLTAELEREGVVCELHWLDRTQRSLGASRSEVHAWTRALAAALSPEGALAKQTPDAVLLHYSVFSYAYKGVPVFAPAVLSALRAQRVPIVGFMHELAYPWRHNGLRGSVWALTHRVVLRALVGACAATIVTADFRVRWLTTRRWLPHRPVVMAPVFSALPPPHNAASAARYSEQGADRAGPQLSDREGAVIGLFGYSYEGVAADLVLDAVRTLRDRGQSVRLSLLGAPGRGSAAGEAWTAAAAARGVAEAVSFSGMLPAQELSDALAACEVLVFADLSGPSSRKSSLAAALASGVPVVALEGPHAWGELVRRQAAQVVAPTAAALTDALAGLLAHEPARRAQGKRGSEFAAREMTVQRSAHAVRALLEELIGGARA